MRRTLALALAALVAASAPAPAWARKKKKDPAPPAAAAPGTVTLDSKSLALVDGATGDSWSYVDEILPVRFRLTGPARFQVEFRVNMKDAALPTAILSAHAGGKPVQSWRVTAKPGGGEWKGMTIKPSLPIGFFVDVPTGEEAWEFRIKGAMPDGAAILVVASDKARKPLAANSATIRAPAAAAIAMAATPMASPAVTPVAATPPAAIAGPARGSGAWAVEAGPVGYVRWSAKRFDPVAPAIAVHALKPLAAAPAGLATAVGVGVGWRHHTGGRTFEEFRGRVLAPYIADVDAFPVEGLARASRPMGSLDTFLQVGLGLEYARSSFAKEDELPRRWRENDWAPTGSLGAGANRPLLGGRLGARFGVRVARHAFAAHDFEVLHGVEGSIAWGKSF